MHLSARAFQLLLLTALLAVAGQWGDDPALRNIWQWPLALLVFGLCFERFETQRLRLQLQVDGPRVLLLGQPQALEFVLEQSGRSERPLLVAPAVPAGFALLGDPVNLLLPAGEPLAWRREVTALRLGSHDWPVMPVRIAGRLGLAWWSRELAPQCQLAVAPDTHSQAVAQVRGTQSGANARLRPGRGAELLQLRDYQRGDPVARIDWKNTARRGRLITREYSEDQHLDILLAIDAGRLSRTRAGELDRLGLYANVAARFAAHAVQRDDRVGMLVYAEQPLAMCMPDRGLRAVAAIRRQLLQLRPQRGESAPLPAALRIRAMLRQRSLVIWLADLEDETTGEALRAAALALMPPHLALLAGVRSEDIAALATAPAREWHEPWIALAAREELRRTETRLAQLRAIGAPLVYVPAQDLEQAVFDEYEALRLRRLRPQRRTGGLR